MSEAVPHLQEGCLSSCSCTLPGGNQLYIPVLSLKTSQTVVQHELLPLDHAIKFVFCDSTVAALSRDSLFINFLNTNNYEKEHFSEIDDGGHGSHNVHDIHSLWR